MRTLPASNIPWMPPMSEMRTPWESSTFPKPRSRISWIIGAPSVWRAEFQQQEKESTAGLFTVYGFPSTGRHFLFRRLMVQ